MGKSLEVVAIGEVLWDFIGSEKHLGGAPFNFAVHCHYLGSRSSIVSRVGRDELGDEILARARDLGVDASLIQRDDEHPTGQVRVTLHAGGQPTFDIRADAAYDYLAADPETLSRVRCADVVYFGALSQRHPAARRSIASLLANATQALVVCDLNLRPPYYSAERVRESLSQCDLLKLNQEELRVLQAMMGQDDLDQDELLLHLLGTYGLDLICVTLGARGCILRTRGERVASPGYACQVVDTVGSGDGFAAALVVRYAEGRPLSEAADFANLVGAYVATQPGATPPLTPGALESIACRETAQGGLRSHGSENPGEPKPAPGSFSS